MAENNARIIITAEDRASKALQQIGHTAGGTVADLLRLNGQLSALGAGASLAGLGLMATQAIEFAANLHDLSQQTGASVEDLSALRDVAEENGTSLEAAGKALQKLSRNMAEAAGGARSQADTFAQLGVSVTDASGKLRNSGQAMADIAMAIAQIDSPTERVAAAMDVFGKSGAELLPMLLDLAKRGELVATVTAEQAAQADAFADSLTRLRQGVRNAGEATARDFLPAFAAIADVGQGVLTTFSLVGRSLAVIANDIATFGQVAAIGLAAGFTDEGQAKIKELLDSRARFMEAANEDLDEIVGNYESILGRVLNPELDKQAKGGRSYKGGGGDAKERIKKTVDEFAILLNRLNATDAGLDPSFRKDLDTLFAGYDKDRIKLDEYRAAVEKLIAAQSFAKDAAKAEAAAQKEYTDGVKAAAQAIEDGLAALEDRATAAEAEVANYGKTKSAIEDTIIARLEEQRKMVAGFDSQAELVANLEKEIAARKRARDAFKNLESADSAAKGAEAAAREWQKFADDIERSLTDSLFRAFESGKGFGESFVDSLRNTLRTAALKVVVQAVTSPITSALQTAGGLSGAASGASALSGIGSLISAGGSLIGSGAVGEFGAGLAGTFVGPTQAGSAASIGASIGAAMPYIAAATLAYSLFATKSTPHSGGFAEFSAGSGLETNAATRGAGRNMGGTGFRLDDFNAGATDAASNMVRGVVTLFDGLAQRFGLQGGFSAATGFADDSSGDGAWGAFRLSVGGQDLVNWTRGGRGNGPDFADGEQGQAQYAAAVAASVRDALNQLDLPAWADDMLAALGDAPSLEAIAATVDTINQTASAIAGLRPLFEQVGVTSEAAIVKIAEALGGLEAAGSAVAGYIAAIYTPAEQMAMQQQAIAAAFSDLNLDLPTTRAGFRALVESLDLTTEAGQNTFAALLALAPAFAQLVDAADATAADITAAAQQTEAARRSWQDRLDVATGVRSQRDIDLERDLASTDDPATQALIRRVYAAEAMAGDAWTNVGNIAADAADSTASAWQSTADSIAATLRALRGEQIGSGSRGFAAAQADFALATAAARAGDQSAASRLPELARAVVELGRGVVGTSAEQAVLTARTMAALRSVLDSLARIGVDVPAFAAGTNYVPATMLATVHAGERIIPAADNTAILDALRGGHAGDPALLAQVAALRAEVRAVAAHAYDTVKALRRVTEDDALRTVAAT